MADLWNGMKRFTTVIYPARRERFQRLAERNSPKWMVITCADGRILPCEKFGPEPGDLFMLRVAGQIVPPYGMGGGEEATIVLAVRLGVREVFIMGHSDCGAIKGMLNPELICDMPAMSRMLQCSGTCAHSVKGVRGRLKKQRKLTELHVVQQMRNVAEYPQVKPLLEAGEFQIHGLIFDIGTGTFTRYDDDLKRFVPVEMDGQPLRVDANVLSG